MEPERTSHLATPSLPPTVTVSAAARVLGVHEKTVRRAVARGQLASFRVGRRVLIPTHKLIALMEGRCSA